LWKTEAVTVEEKLIPAVFWNVRTELRRSAFSG
jgi:hypothetical protein